MTTPNPVSALDDRDAVIFDFPTDRTSSDATPAATADAMEPDNSDDTSPDNSGVEVGGNVTSLQVDLDDRPSSGGMPVDPAPVSADDPPMIPPALQGWANIKQTVTDVRRRTTFRLGFHAVRTPWYAMQAALYAPIGAKNVVSRQVRWWWVAEQHSMRQAAADDNDPATWLKLHREVKATRTWRGMVLGAQAAGAAVLLSTPATRGWAELLAVCAGVPLLARFGRPVDKPILSKATVTSRFRVINADVVLRAYYAAGLGNPDKPKEQITFGSPMSREGDGSRVVVDLPYGKGLNDAIKAQDAIASGLDVALSQVLIRRDPTSHRRHVLWVADRDPLATPAGRTPLLACKPTDIWTPAPFGLDERGRLVTVDMMWNSLLFGAMPRSGKSWSARVLALFAALDPYVRLSVFDAKGSPDWRKFALVADACAFGLAMTRDGDPLETVISSLQGIKRDVQHRYQALSELPVDVCPEGKLTRDIARDPRYKMPVRVVVLDEFQEYFDTPDQDANKEIASLLVFLVKVAPAAGVIVMGATQKPSGIGTGPVGQMFNAYRDNHQIRFALRTGSWQNSDLILGAGAYTEGYNSSLLLPEYKGVGILRGASETTPTVRTHLADAKDAEKILTAARGLRQQAGTLSGYAAGEAVAKAVRDVLADVRNVVAVSETFVPWTVLATRLAEQMPEQYAKTTAATISAQVRAFGIASSTGKFDGRSQRGMKVEQLQGALRRRDAAS